MSAKAAAPKTIYQFRNVSYCLVGWLGFMKGYAQKSENDRLWTAHRAEQRRVAAMKLQAEADEKLARERAASPIKIPVMVPGELQELYTTFSSMK